MDFLIKRDSLYNPLKRIINIISNRPRLPILSHILLEINKDYLFITATNLEIEIIAQISLDQLYPSESITISGHKLFEICRNLSEKSKISIKSKNNKIIINSENSNFSLSSLPPSNFPKTKEYNNNSNIIISQYILKKIIQHTQFSMGKQDARYYLNGMFFDFKQHTIRVVATDGYRLAMCEINVDSLLPSTSIIIPRKGILEILHLLNTDKETVKIQIHNNCIFMKTNNYIFSTKLIDATFPNYQNIFLNQPKNIFEIERLVLQKALKRASILSHEKLRCINLHLTTNQLKITSYNFQQETSEENLEIQYQHKNMDISFNVDYLLDIVNTIESELLKFSLINSESSIQIEGVPKNYGSTYILMPIKI